MRTARLAGLLLTTILAISLVSAQAASAGSGNPLFVPAAGQAATAISGVTTLREITGQIIVCQKDSATGTVTSSLLLGKVFWHFLECTAKEKEGATTTCTIHSLGAPEEGLIITTELHGILGLILPSLQTGILFLPTNNSTWTELAESKNGATKCTSESKVTGTLAGLVTPVRVSQTTGLITFPKEPIKTIDLTHGIGSRKPELNIFTGQATLEQDEKITYGVATEVT